MIGDDNLIYEIRGFNFQGEVSRNTSASNFNDIGIFVAFIGTFTNIRPSERQVRSFNWFLENSVQREVLIRNYTILSQEQLGMTESLANGIIEALNGTAEFYSCKFIKIFLRNCLLIFF